LHFSEINIRIIARLCIAASFLVSCSGDKKENIKSKSRQDDLGRIAALPLEAKAPADNPTTPEKIELGRMLFWDPILAGNKDVACATCHHPEFGYAENLDISIGVNGKGFGQKRVFREPNEIPFTKRNAQGLLNVAFNGIDMNGQYDPATAPMFWDLRSKGLEDQSLHPIRQLEEMRGTRIDQQAVIEVVIARLKSIPEYRQKFSEAFDHPDGVNEANLARALASFERSLLANHSRFDQYMRGDKKAMSSSEIEGMNLFIKTGCARCHNGPMLSDFKTHMLGVKMNEKLGHVDSGFRNSFAFRTPTLRNLRFTMPFMHSGSIQTLENVMTFYEDLQGHELPNKLVSKDSLDPLAKQLNVEFRDISRIVEFLNTLNDPDYDKKIPTSVPSGLPVGGNIK
jgi:cytochrome c peroxidase